MHSSQTGTFTPTDNGTRWVFHGALTMDDASRVLEDAEALPLPSKGIVDFRGLLQGDSAAIAVMIALRRRAAAEGKTLAFASLPDALESLAIVYGVDKLLA
ncbi:MAG TPA: STAS domain-containing protein [Casimicrobiaceae bacterium]|jgi:phospholipid transport system transporter-binding protein